MVDEDLAGQGKFQSQAIQGKAEDLHCQEKEEIKSQSISQPGL